MVYTEPKTTAPRFVLPGRTGQPSTYYPSEAPDHAEQHFWFGFGFSGCGSHDAFSLPKNLGRGNAHNAWTAAGIVPQRDILARPFSEHQMRKLSHWLTRAPEPVVFVEF